MIDRTGKFIRIGIVAMPVGLITIGMGSVLWSTRDKPRTYESEQPLFGGRGAKAEAITVEALEEHITVLTERIGPRNGDNLNRARFYLNSTLGLDNIGYNTLEQRYTVDGAEYANVEAELPGIRWADQIIVVGAHYDSVNASPGADDNASGVAAMLVLADAFAGTKTGRTIRFVGFTNEEPPWFQTENMGSAKYAARCVENGEKIVAMLSLDSIGYFSDEPNSQNYPAQVAEDFPTTGNFVAVVSNPESASLGEYIQKNLRSSDLIPSEFGAFPAAVEAAGMSDHWSFWERGFAALMVTGTGPFRNPNNHQETDTLETLDLERLSAAANALERAIR
ncbi:MAG: M28 family peptidase, partial [Verrucomicrobiota bacterium]